MWQDWGEEGEGEKSAAEKKRRRKIKEKIKNKHSRMDGWRGSVKREQRDERKMGNVGTRRG